MSSEKAYLKVQSSVVEVPGFGFAYVLHFDGEDPLAVMKEFAAGKERGVGGPFSTMDEAKTAGSAALTETMKQLNQRGVKASRPPKA